MEASVATTKEVKNLYQLKLMHMMSFVKDERTFEDIRALLIKYLHEKLDREIARVEEEKGYTAQTYQDLLDGKLVLK